MAIKFCNICNRIICNWAAHGIVVIAVVVDIYLENVVTRETISRTIYRKCIYFATARVAFCTLLCYFLIVEKKKRRIDFNAVTWSTPQDIHARTSTSNSDACGIYPTTTRNGKYHFDYFHNNNRKIEIIQFSESKNANAKRWILTFDTHTSDEAATTVTARQQFFFF